MHSYRTWLTSRGIGDCVSGHLCLSSRQPNHSHKATSQTTNPRHNGAEEGEQSPSTAVRLGRVGLEREGVGMCV